MSRKYHLNDYVRTKIGVGRVSHVFRYEKDEAMYASGRRYQISYVNGKTRIEREPVILEVLDLDDYPEYKL